MKYILVISFILTSTTVPAQSLIDSKWKTEINSITYALEFLTDSLNLFIDIEKIELSTFYTNQDTLFLMDHEGANCLSVGKYIFRISNDSLTLSLINDDCPNRGNFLNDLILEKCILSANTNATNFKENTIYPNPSHNGFFYIKNNHAHAKYNIYDLSGNKIQMSLDNGFIDLSDLPKSIYILEIIIDNSRLQNLLINQ